MHENPGGPRPPPAEAYESISNTMVVVYCCTCNKLII